MQKMAGVEAAEDLTVDQLNAMAGGELLKSEVCFTFFVIFVLSDFGFGKINLTTINCQYFQLCNLKKHSTIFKKSAKSNK